MAIPPFPAQDLAKLVLGYLVEEQLMTAYDEFLHTSPYLDAQKNEYDRIFMHSLRKILAEYRAVRIHVEACKPISLRKKLLQCNNLLEIVTFLVRHIDVNKLQRDASNERVSFDSQDVSTSKNGCDACNALRLRNCECSHTKRNVSSSKPCNDTESIDAVETLTQTTSLSDLPGNQEPPINRHVRVLEPQLSHPASNSGQNHEVPTFCANVNNASTEQSSTIANNHVQTKTNPINSVSLSAAYKSTVLPNTTSMECSQNIAEFNTVLKQMYSNSIGTGSGSNSSNMTCTERNTNRMSITGTFQDFSTGVMGGVPKTNINVPDSSTSENMHVQLPLPLSEKDNKAINKRKVKTGPRKQCMYRVGNLRHDITESSNEIIDIETVDEPSNLKPDEQKVTIISDIKVGNDNRLISRALTSTNATSTPLLQTQTVFINGTPVFKPKPPEQRYTFTRDEIMAMPTIILVPASGPLQTVSSTSVQPQNLTAKSSCTKSSTSTRAPPLTVDVSNSSSNTTNNLSTVQNVPTQGEQTTVGKSGLVTTVDAIKNASVPKDSIVPSSGSTNTPQMLPPKRRSSSTPRRTSHVRVLDFTTPRRILSETINEDPNQEGVHENCKEIFISKSPNLSIPQGSTLDSAKNQDPVIKTTDKDTITNLREENNSDHKKPILRKASNWDADLRALAIVSESVDKRTPAPKPKPKSKVTKKAVEEKDPEKKLNDVTSVNKTKKRTIQQKNNVTPNITTSKKKTKHTADKNVSNPPIPDVPAQLPPPDLPAKVGTSDIEKPNTCIKESNKEQNKSNDEDRIDTPEVERLSLHNEIGVKLNISDLLETPYKQALYDIQIETPRFLGPDLPDDPMSDIKIMDIPTPRFLSSNSNMPYTPKPAQITPSSYSSRQTDYSSGGSYYKPDDQDYIPIMEDIVCPVTSTLPKDNSKSATAESSKLKESQPKEKSRKNRSRPIRQCTKNVSYYNSPASIKTNETDKKDDVSSCSDTISINSSFDNTIKESTATSKSIDKSKRSTKGANNKSPRLIKKLSPLKKVSQKPFMKIKPRRPTPTKDSAKKSNRKISDTSQNSIKRKSRNRSTSKDKSTSVTSLAVPAPTKSRRKSSTPRKLHCTKTLNSESSDHESPEVKQSMQAEIQSSSVSCIHDSDTEQLRLRWSDDGSQDTRVSANEADEISQIKEYINKTVPTEPCHNKNDGSLQNDLIKRGFDEETAKIIERDLLKSPVNEDETEKVIFLEPSTDESKTNKALERSVESDCSTLTSSLVINEENDIEYVELSVQECNEESANFITVQHDDTVEPPKHDLPKLKDKFSMEVFIDEGVVVRLRATALKYFPDENVEDLGQSLETNRETEIAVSSISNMDRLYSPFKDAVRAQCYDIFNSTLTSIDTPLKADSPKRDQDCTITEIIIDENEIEIVETKEKSGNRKRKRSHCSSASEESVNGHRVGKKVKPETQYILNSKELKNLDIENVLSRLHGP